MTRELSSRRYALVVVLGFLTARCGAEGRHAEGPEATPPGGAGNPSQIASAQLEAERPEGQREAETVVAAALARTAALRELAALEPVEGQILSRAGMAESVRERIETDVPADVVSGSAAVLVALGLVPRDFDYVASLLSLMTSQLAGFYDPNTKTMYLAADLEGPERQATLTHELVHALQDQHYTLGELIEFKPEATDAQSAVHALAEGDATSLMLDDLLSSSGQTALDVPESLLGVQVRAAIELSSEVKDVPGIIKRSVVAPYVDGVEFVNALRRKGGWAKVDAVWKSPPQTTEQLLHLDKLEAREVGEAIDLPAPPSSIGAESRLYSDVMGEQSVRLVFEEWLPRSAAITSAAGWSGDRIVVYRTPGVDAVIWHLRWDTAALARVGFEAFARGALGADAASVGKDVRAAARAAAGRGVVCADRGELGPFTVLLSERDVVVALGPYGRTGSVADVVMDCPKSDQWARSALAQRSK